MAKTKNYQVQAKLNLLACVSISAPSLEEAINQSKNLKESDFVEFLGDYLDGDMRITGVYESEP